MALRVGALSAVLIDCQLDFCITRRLDLYRHRSVLAGMSANVQLSAEAYGLIGHSI